ncbi:uncharacterized protein J3R85_006014 [Psidium guajava]|nr:uncharacterized protein J3R85_006014 [Psidium guajava]
MQTAWEQGRLVLLQNLDPTYASSEVEDIIWQGFKEKCSAKMLPQTPNCSPHYGQAFVILETEEAAKRVIKELDAGCLVLPDGRPLIGCVKTPCSPGDPETPDMEEAVYTLEPGNIEYVMAMQWRSLQQKSDIMWEMLHKRQGEELREIKAKLKSQ